MSNKRVWVTKYGKGIKIKDMNDKHLLNATRMVVVQDFRREYLRDMLEEIARRNLYVDFTLAGVPFTMRDGRTLLSMEDSKPMKKSEQNKEYVIIRRPKYESITESDTSRSQESTLGASQSF